MGKAATYKVSTELPDGLKVVLHSAGLSGVLYSTIFIGLDNPVYLIVARSIDGGLILQVSNNGFLQPEKLAVLSDFLKNIILGILLPYNNMSLEMPTIYWDIVTFGDFKSY